LFSPCESPVIVLTVAAFVFGLTATVTKKVDVATATTEVVCKDIYWRGTRSGALLKMDDDDLLKRAVSSLLSMGAPEQSQDRDLRAAAKAAQQLVKLCAEYAEAKEQKVLEAKIQALADGLKKATAHAATS